MTPMTALPARTADLSVQGAARPGRATTTREDLARSRDDFARTLERESSVPDRTTSRTDRAADRGADRAADRTDRTDRAAARSTDRAATSPVGKAVRAAERAAALAADGTGEQVVETAEPAAIVAAPVSPAVATLAAELGLGLPVASGDTPAEAGPLAAAPDSSDGAAPVQDGAGTTTSAAATLAASTVATQVAPSAPATKPAHAAQAVPTAPVTDTQVAAATATGTSQRTGETSGATAGALGPSGEAAAPLVVDGSRVVLTGAGGGSGARSGAQADSRGAAPAPVAPVADGAGTGIGSTPADAVAGRSGDAPVAVQPPTTSPAQSFAQILTGAVDRPAATQAPAAPANTPHVPLAEQVRGPLVALKTAAPGEHMLTLRVDPEQLGPVQVRAHIGADGIRIELVGATDAARDSLRGLLTDLRRDLSATGMNATLSLASDTAGQQGRHPAGAADLFGGQPGASGQPGSRRTGESPAGAATTSTDPTTDLRSTTATTHGAHGVDVLI